MMYVCVCLWKLWLSKCPSCFILVRHSDITQLVHVSSIGRSQARSAPCAWWVYPTATTFRKARHHRSCYVRRAMRRLIWGKGRLRLVNARIWVYVCYQHWTRDFSLCECGQSKDWERSKCSNHQCICKSWPTAWVKWLSDSALLKNKSTQVGSQPRWINLRICDHVGSSMLHTIYRAWIHVNPITPCIFP